MAYYDAFIAKWNTLTPDTTVNKLAALNSSTVTGSIPSTIMISGAQVLNCVNYAEFKVLTATQQINILTLCSATGLLLGGSANTTHLLVGMLLDFFPVAGPTIASLTALAQASAQPWWQANGYQRAFDMGDVAAAGVN